MIRRIFGYGVWVSLCVWAFLWGRQYDLNGPLVALELVFTGLIAGLDWLGHDEHVASKQANAPPPKDP